VADKNLPKILIVDDGQHNLLAMQAILDNVEADVITANSGSAALALMLEHEFVLVLLDVNMPDMDGFETATLMHSNNQTRHTPIIFISAYNRDEIDFLKGYEVGAVDYITKPVIPEILMGKVTVFLQLYEQSRLLEEKIAQMAAMDKVIKQKNQQLEKNNKKLEQSNAERQQQFIQTRRLLEMNPDGMLVIDHKNIILYSNPAGAALFNRDAEQLQGEVFGFPIVTVQSQKSNSAMRTSLKCV